MGKKELVLEVSIFLFLIVPSMVLSYFIIQQGTLSFTVTSLSVIMRDLALASLVFFFLWRNAEHVSVIGWTARGVVKEGALGILLYVPLFFLVNVVDQWLSTIGFKAPSMPLPSLTAGRGVFDVLLGVVLVTVVAFSEETIFRGYLMLRFTQVTASPVVAVAVSTLVFVMGHGYEGSLGLASVTVMGLVFALVYLWRRSLVAPVVMHFIQDFLGVVLLPLLVRK
jgi:membrane protease YdiL (CAAX protease family)